MRKIIEAASQWEFFQDINSGIALEILKSKHLEQQILFFQPFMNNSSSYSLRVAGVSTTCLALIGLLEFAGVNNLPEGLEGGLFVLFSKSQHDAFFDAKSLKDTEDISMHEVYVTTTPTLLKQIGMVVPLEQKLDMLWNFIKTHLHSKILVFFSSYKQVKFEFEAFSKLHHGILLKCLQGRMK